MDIRLKVDPKVMEQKAGLISVEVTKLEKQWNNIQEIVRNSRGYWQGDASEAHQRYFKDVSGDVPQMIRKLKEHHTDLMKMAGVYKAAESASKGAAAKLPDDVID